jgi:hypothetical protein
MSPYAKSSLLHISSFLNILFVGCKRDAQRCIFLHVKPVNQQILDGCRVHDDAKSSPG